jgi:hypothetical protein
MTDGQPVIPQSVAYNAETSYQHQTGKSSSSVNDYLSRQAPDLGTTVPDLKNTAASRFPSRVGHGDPRDEKMALKAQLLQDAQYGYLPGVGVAQATDADFQYFKDKELAEREADFKRFFLSNIDLSDPVKQDYYQRLYPEIFSERESLAEKQIEHQAHMMKINLRGPRNMEDWMFLYGLDRGFIQVPKGPIWDPDNLLKTSFEGGLFSIRKILPRNPDGVPTLTNAYHSGAWGKQGGLVVNHKEPLTAGGVFNWYGASKAPFSGAPTGTGWNEFLAARRT